MKRYAYVAIDTSTYEGENPDKLAHLQDDLNRLGSNGLRLVASAGPLLIMEDVWDDDPQ